ncbi:MAG: tripartite tricarboxylate transporter substrate binding protein [Pigmentiphaga sp.]|uniref:Bug family tripartite tricarboxylate transporter substrate binding protein n=1 Tax=Pigmentiphaga sp. TaxID=1977564 RepID=UPI0029A84D6C|nr:tripartite tricarboxylate transporter substrate binding protein [Pigmentiphaga sp.]MDX3904761.1 tripartite tricarboxylate transporter substrate binding protein [Pigmentiphaga sp.]
MRIILHLFVALALAAPALSSAAGDWPGSRPVRLVVPASAGGSLDTLARPLAQAMSDLSGGRFIVENVGGAAGMIGAHNVVKAAPDGYTFLFGAIHHVILPIAYPKMPYDTATDLTPIGLIATVPNVVLVRSDSPFRTLDDLVRTGKTSQQGLNYGTGGKGGLHHLSAEHFKLLTGAKMQAVHYRGSAPAITDLLGGQIDLMFETMPMALSQIRSGSLRALAVTSAARSPALPDTPTLAEAGVPDLAVTTWYGLFGPAKLPPQVSQHMRALMAQALATDKIKALWKDYGATVDGPGAKDFPAFVASELRHWADVGRRIDFKPGE